MGDDNAVEGLVAGDAVVDIFLVIESGLAIKAPLDTAEDVEWVVLEVLLLSKVMAKLQDFSSVIVTSFVVVK